jgi:uncharacterized protein
MTNEERDLITQFVARVSGARAASQPPSAWGGSVPTTTGQQPPAQPLPPVDPQADQHIHSLFQQLPEAPYRLTQLAFVQEHALAEAQNRIQRLEWELQQAQQAAEQQTQQPPASSGGGFFGSLFGGRAQPAPQPGSGPAWNRGAAQPQPQPQPQWQQQPPPPQYPPNYQPGVFQSGGGTGFFGSALRSAAGVAGGILAADTLMNLFSGNRGGGAPFAGGPWGGASTPVEPGYVDQGTWDQSGGGPAPDQNYVDNGSWDQPTDPGSSDSSWNDAGSSDDGSGWDAGGGDTGGGGDSLC